MEIRVILRVLIVVTSLFIVVYVLHVMTLSRTEISPNYWKDLKTWSKYCNCSENQRDKTINSLENKNVSSLIERTVKQVLHTVPVIYGVMPTYYRLAQKAELTRLCYALKQAQKFHWIIVEDALNKSTLVENILNSCNVTYTHLNIAAPKEQKASAMLKGTVQRNAGLHWIRSNTDLESGVVYFMDDDNTYDIRLFEQMRYTKKVSVWPVAFVGSMQYESPIVKNGKVVGWRASWEPKRRFPIDMAGFAVSLKLLSQRPKAGFSLRVTDHCTESDFLISLNITVEDLEPMAKDCTQILVWHTQTRPVDTHGEISWKKTHQGEKLFET